MKRIIIVCIAVICIPYGTYSRSINLDKIENVLKNIQSNMAKTLSHAVLANTAWSNTYVGMFPNTAIGLQFGIGSNNMATLIFSGLPMDKKLTQASIAMPITLSARMGLPYKHIDVGLHVFYLPIFVDALSLSIISAGTDLRYEIIQETPMIPNVAIGIGYMYSGFLLGFTMGDTIFKGIDSIDSVVRVKIAGNKLDLQIHTHTISLNTQANKTFFGFLTPFICISPYVYMADTSTEMKGTVYTSKDSGNIYTFYSSFNDIAYEFLSEKGLAFKEFMVGGGLRVSTGVGFAIAWATIDAQVSYEPFSNSLAAIFGVRGTF